MDLSAPEPLSRLFDYLPAGPRDFLNSGGWLLVGLVLILFLLLLLGLTLRALWRRLFGAGDVPDDSDADYIVNLEECPLPVGPPPERRLTVYHLPVRVRLVIVAPMGRETNLDAIAVEKTLDQVLFGLSDIVRGDRPLIRAWPAQLSHHGFATAFHRRMRRPEPDHLASQWILVSGRAKLGNQPLLVGFGLWADEPNMVGRLTLEPYQWLDVLRLQIV
jgi:hypothetical protein